MRSRLTWVAALVGLWIVAIVARLVFFQVANHETYSAKAERQQQRVVEIDPPRGTIFDARGRELAVSVEVESLFAVPREVEDPAAAARRLAPILRLPRAEIVKRLEADREFVWVARKLDPPVAEAVRGLKLKGLHFLREHKRYYPMGELAAAVLGFVGTDNQGLAGLEVQYDKAIRGLPGERTVLRDARRSVSSPPSLPEEHAQPGDDLHLTIDAALQHIAEEELARGVDEHRARGGSAILLDPRSGAVLAMASFPGFDPSRFGTYDAERLANPAVSDAYEPGSTFKAVTFAAALEANTVDPNDMVDCEMGGITLYKTRIRDHKPFGRLSFRDVLAVSSNVGTIKLGMRLERPQFYATIRGFGFGAPSGIDLPGESAGLLQPLERWGALTPAYVSFGQGIAATPLQVVNSFAVIANGGTLWQPYLVAAIGKDGTLRSPRERPHALGHPISRSTARELERMLEGVISGERGTGKSAQVPGFHVAGKTGTAQTAEEGQGYSADRRVPSFVGFVPAREPRLVGLVVIDTPRAGLVGGSAVAAPVFARIAARALAAMGIAPDAIDEAAPEAAKDEPGKRPLRAAVDGRCGGIQELPCSS